jgi:hypothetical protein
MEESLKGDNAVKSQKEDLQCRLCERRMKACRSLSSGTGRR